MTDEGLVELAQGGYAGAADVLIERYKGMVRSRSRAYFIVGADTEDIIQEGMIGLFKAIRDYRPEATASFSTFAQLCVTRQILSAIKAAARQKHMPLNTYLPVSEAENSIAPTHTNPEQLLISKENKFFIEANLEKLLTDMELRVLQGYLHGKSYARIALELCINPKAVENALARVRRKVSKILANSEERTHA